MNIRRLFCFGLALSVMLTGVVTPVWADGGWRRDHDRGREHERYRERERQHERDRDWIMDRRYNHNHYYPRRGHVVRELPGHYRVFRHRNNRYYFDDGIWYRSGSGGFVVVTPPFGLELSLLPPFYTTIWVGGVPYYYADGVYYRWLPEQRTYVVSEPPPEQKVVPDSEIPRDLFIYPKEGQTQEKQDSDRYECHRWSVGQTGFDPTQPGGDVPAAENAGKHVEYQRAMKACLEARGYSVQ